MTRTTYAVRLLTVLSLLAAAIVALPGASGNASTAARVQLRPVGCDDVDPRLAELARQYGGCRSKEQGNPQYGFCGESQLNSTVLPGRRVQFTLELETLEALTPVVPLIVGAHYVISWRSNRAVSERSARREREGRISRTVWPGSPADNSDRTSPRLPHTYLVDRSHPVDTGLGADGEGWVNANVPVLEALVLLGGVPVLCRGRFPSVYTSMY